MAAALQLVLDLQPDPPRRPRPLLHLVPIQHAAAPAQDPLIPGRVLEPDPAWLRHALCAAALTSGRIDLTSVDDGTDPATVRQARAVCMACPVTGRCRTYALHIADVAGMAGGMTEAQRTAWRARHGVPAPAEEPMGRRHVSPTSWTAIVDLTRRGWTADRIAKHLDDPGVTARTVAYVRQVVNGSKRQAGRAPGGAR